MVDSIRVRLALWHTLTIAALLAVFSVGTWFFLVRTTGERADQSLADMAKSFVRVWGGVRNEEETSNAVSAATAAHEYRDRDRRLVVYDGAGRLIAISDTTPLTPALSRTALADTKNGVAAALIRAVQPGQQVFATLESEADESPPVRALASGIREDGQPFTILALRSLRAEEDATDSFRTALLVAIPIALILAGLGGYLLARASLAPVVAMGRQAERVSASNLHQRLSVKNSRDELGSLATVLNGLLARLETAFQHEQQTAERQRQFMADASHELRTPVAALSSVADVALARKDRDPAELREALDIVRGEGHRLGRLVDDLLFLSRADAGELPVQREKLYLEEVLQDSVRAARGLAAARGINLQLLDAEEAPLHGDPHLLRRLVMILLDNAIKYTPRGGEVRVSLEQDRRAPLYRIIVDDTGPGVAAGARERIFERFYSADVSRARTDRNGGESGAGLGLAIARFTAESHGGTVALAHTGPNGSRFVATLPMSEA
ncbi:MAG TPA: ATP-binding protein [Gemmatimonadaceae bacterium]|nr:ATP-binding protein [Gemmatimonadaceae bacterium]